jgi:hypothetical protein
MSKSDTPIAYICEYDNKQTIISRTFIFYDANKETYCLRGLVWYELDGDTPQFAYNCKTVGAIFDYLDFINDKDALYTYELFNYKKNTDSDAMTFELLHANKSHWLSAYDGQKYDKKRIGQLLRIVRGLGQI